MNHRVQTTKILDQNAFAIRKIFIALTTGNLE